MPQEPARDHKNQWNSIFIRRPKAAASCILYPLEAGPLFVQKVKARQDHRFFSTLCAISDLGCIRGKVGRQRNGAPGSWGISEKTRARGPKILEAAFQPPLSCSSTFGKAVPLARCRDIVQDRCSPGFRSRSPPRRSVPVDAYLKANIRPNCRAALLPCKILKSRKIKVCCGLENGSELVNVYFIVNTKN